MYCAGIGNGRMCGADIRRRFVAGMSNFRQVYQARVDFWQWFDNGGPAPLLLAEGGSP